MKFTIHRASPVYHRPGSPTEIVDLILAELYHVGQEGRRGGVWNLLRH